MTNIRSKSKMAISFAVLITFIISVLYLISILFLNMNGYTNNNPIMFFWIIFAFVSGLLSLGSRNIYPFAVALTTGDEKYNTSMNSRKLISLSLGIISSLVILGFSFGYIGSAVNIVFNSLNIVSSYIYILSGVGMYIISLSALNFFKIERSNMYPNIFNKNNNLLNIFISGFISSFIDLLPLTLLLIAESVSEGDGYYGMILFIFHAIGRVLPLFIIETISRFGINTKRMLMSIKENLNTYLNVYLLAVSSLLLYFGLVFYVQEKGNVHSSIVAFLYNGWLIAMLWLLPLWFKFFKEERRVYKSGADEFKLITQKIKNIENECDDLKRVYRFNEKSILDKVSHLKEKLHTLVFESKIIESSIRHNAKYPIRTNEDQKREERGLKYRLISNILITLLVITLITLFVY